MAVKRLASTLGSETGAPSPAVAAALEFIAGEYGQPITTHDIAQAVGLSRSYLAMRFRRETGKTLHGHVVDLRLAEAARRIAAGKKIEAVALEVEFRSPAALYRRFKARTHDSPAHALRGSF